MIDHRSFNKFPSPSEPLLSAFNNGYCIPSNCLLKDATASLASLGQVSHGVSSSSAKYNGFWATLSSGAFPFWISSKVDFPLDAFSAGVYCCLAI